MSDVTCRESRQKVWYHQYSSFRNIVVYVLFRKISVENGEEMVITNLVINQVPGTFSSCLLLLIKDDDQRSLSLC